MADVERIFRAFRGIRYATEESGDLSDVIAPPYDVISEEMQVELYARSEHNFVRVELAKGSSDTRYAEASGVLGRWLSEGVLTRDVKPSLYVLEQEFAVEGRTWKRRGIFGLVRLPEAHDGFVLSHEGTLPAPKADRLRLMQACRAMTSPIMLMADDPEGALMQVLDAAGGEPEATAKSADGTTNRLFVIQDAEALSASSEAVGPGPLYIADGHHRFETASAYRDEMRRAHPDAPPDAGFNHALVLVNSARDKGLRIFPTHRLVSGLNEAAQRILDECIERDFEVSTDTVDQVDDWEDLAWLTEADAQRPAFGVYRKRRLHRLIAKDSALPTTERVVDKLDVSVLHARLIDPMLAGAGGEAVSDISHDSHAAGPTVRGARLTYTTDAREAMAAVNRGDYDCAFFLRPTRVSEVMAAARAGERMPGKSTYFFPKIPAGLLVSDASENPI